MGERRGSTLSLGRFRWLIGLRIGLSKHNRRESQRRSEECKRTPEPRGKKFSQPKMQATESAGRTGFRPGQRVRHPKYGEGMVYKREGDGEDAKITVQFPRFGLKKLVEKYAQLEKA